MNGEEFVLVQLDDGNIGEHPVRGLITKTFYGYRGHGSRFLMHTKDVAAHTAGKTKLRVMRVTEDMPQEPEQPVEGQEEITNPTQPEPQVEDEIQPVEGEREVALLDLDMLTDAQLVELEGMGVTSVKQLVDMGPARIESLKGIGPVKAKQVHQKAQELLKG